MPVEPTHLRGDVWLVDFGAHPEDPEQAFLRPSVIVSDDRLHHASLCRAIVVPGTDDPAPTPAARGRRADGDNGFDRPTAFQVEQVRAIATTRLVERLGRLDAESRYTVDEILRNALALY